MATATVAYSAIVAALTGSSPAAGFLAISTPFISRGGHGQLEIGLMLAVNLGLVFAAGAWLLAAVSINRRQTGRRSPIDTFRSMRAVLRHPPRPVHLRTQVAWVVALVGAVYMSWPFQMMFGVLRPEVLAGAEHATVLEAVVMIPALGALGAAAAAVVSLIKRLSYPSQVRRHPKRTNVQRASRWNWWLHRQRADLTLAFVGGALLFLMTMSSSMWLALAPGATLILLAAALSTQFWRSGERLHLA
jgi:hypothetical protein